MSLLSAAGAFEAAGYSVVPARPDGSKAPIGAWKPYTERRADAAQVNAWLDGDGYDGFGLVCGAVSGNLECAELEGRAATDGAYAQLAELADASGLGELWTRVTNGYLELTPGGGIHLLYRVDGPVPGNAKLARDADGLVLAETRAENGYIIVAPSAGRTHPTGGAWVLLHGGPDSIATITPDERDALHALFRTLDRTPEREMPSEHLVTRRDPGDGTLTPGDDYNARGSWPELLEAHGWTRVYTAGGVTYWCRPGKNRGISATTGRNDGDNLYVFSTSTVFESEKPYSKFGALALLEYGGDYSACARALRQQGYGAQRERTDHVSPADLIAAPVPAPTPAPEPTAAAEQVPDGEPRERTSWWPRDLAPVLSGEDPEPPPQLLLRDDGQPLFYPAKVNGLLGESESGKTWIALLAVAQALEAGRTVVYVDFEDTAPGIVSRLRLMNVPDRQLAHLHYIGPDEALSLGAAQDFGEALDTLAPALVVIDGVNAAMTLLGLDLQDNKDATAFAQKVLRPVARRGAAVVYVDHVPKSKEARGKGGIGAQAKRAMTTGCALAVDVVAEFGRGQTGRLRLTVDKDRAGHVRGASEAGKRAGTAVLTSLPGGGVSVVVQAPDLRGKTEREAASEQKFMTAVSRFLLTQPDFTASQSVIESMVDGGTESIRQGYRALNAGGYTVLSPGPRNATLHTLINAYSDVDELIAPVDNSTSPPRLDLASTSPEASSQIGTYDLATSPPVLRGEARSNPMDPTSEVNCGACGKLSELRTAEINQGYCTPCAVERRAR